MSEAVMAPGAAPRRFADGALNAASTLWFLVLVAGQWLFLYYIAAFYGVTTLSGDFEGWNRHPMTDEPFRAGDTAGNIAFGAHVLLAGVIAFGGTLQLIPHIRARAAWFHRWNGRTFLTAAIVASLAGLYITWTRGSSTGPIGAVSITLNAVLVLGFAALAWRAAAARDIATHRRWALRTFVVVNGVFFLRLMFSAWLVIVQAPPTSIAFHIFSFASYLLPLALVECYLLAKQSGPAARGSMATLLFVASAFMAIGSFGFAMIFIQRILGA